MDSPIRPIRAHSRLLCHLQLRSYLGQIGIYRIRSLHKPRMIDIDDRESESSLIKTGQLTGHSTYKYLGGKTGRTLLS